MTSTYQVRIATLDRTGLPHTDAGLQGLAAGDPLVYVSHQGGVWLRTVADVKRVWLTDNRGDRFRIEDGSGAGDFSGRAYTQADWEYLYEGVTLRSKLVAWGWSPKTAGPQAMTRTQLRMAGRLVERFARMNDQDLPGVLRDAAFGRTGALVIEGEPLIAARRRGSVAETADDLAQLLREGKLDEARSLLESVAAYLGERVTS